MIVLDSAAVHELLTFPIAIDAMRRVMRAFSLGEVTQPVRTIVKPPAVATTGVFAAMPSHVPADDRMWFGIKSIVVKPDNPKRGLHTHLGTVTLFDPDTGMPIAILDASTVTEIRTAAVSAVATDALARSDASDLAVLGAGTQARSHVAAMLAVRPIRRLRVWSRTAARAEEVARWAMTTFGIEASVASSVADAARGAHVICTCTSARDPLLALADVTPGVHINAVGACQPGIREIASDLVAGAAVYLDSKDAARTEAAELQTPISEGLIPATHPRGELGEHLAGKVVGRGGDGEITLYISLGIAAQDIAAAVAVVRAARERDLGATVAFP